MPKVRTIKDKIEHAKDVVKRGIDEYAHGDISKIAVGCSFGKDSMVAVHIAREVDQNMPIFSVMTKYKPKATLGYLKRMNKEMKLGVKVYMVADEIPEILKDENLEVRLMSSKEFLRESTKYEQPLYVVNPNRCCQLLKVEPTQEAVKNLYVWVTGLRNTEGPTRENYEEIEPNRSGPGLVKINPILQFTELDIWRYLAMNEIPVNPLYKQGYRSLGCEPCTVIVGDDKLEREGRWSGTDKKGGECGIHTETLVRGNGDGI